MGRQKCVIFFIFAVFVTTEQNVGIFSKLRGWVPPQIYLVTLVKGDAYSEKSADYRALLAMDHYLVVFLVYYFLLKTESLDNAIQDFSLA